MDNRNRDKLKTAIETEKQNRKLMKEGYEMMTDPFEMELRRCEISRSRSFQRFMIYTHNIDYSNALKHHKICMDIEQKMLEDIEKKITDKNIKLFVKIRREEESTDETSNGEGAFIAVANDIKLRYEQRVGWLNLIKN